MSSIRPVSAPLPRLPAGEVKKPKPEELALKRAAEEFESALLRQLLHSAKIGGKDGDKGYGGMAVDALANGLQAGGGLGLARAIERSLTHAPEVKKR